MSELESLSVYDIPLTQMEQQMVAWASEVIELRFGDAGDPEGRVSLPDYQEGVHAVISSLSRVRQRLDRTEELQTKSMRARARLMRLQSEASFESTRAYDEAAVRRSALRSQEYTSAKERNAEAALDSFQQKRAAHQAARLVSVAQEVEEQIRHCYWGLTKLREDHLSFLRNQQNLTSEEVTS